MGGVGKYFLKTLLGHETFRSMVSSATKYFLKKLQNLPVPPPTYLIHGCLRFRSNIWKLDGFVACNWGKQVTLCVYQRFGQIFVSQNKE